MNSRTIYINSSVNNITEYLYNNTYIYTRYIYRVFKKGQNLEFTRDIFKRNISDKNCKV